MIGEGKRCRRIKGGGDESEEGRENFEKSKNCMKYIESTSGDLSLNR